MQEVSARAARPVLEVLEAAGVDLARLAAHLPYPLDVLRGSVRRIDWNEFVAFVEAVDATCGDRLTLEDVGARLVEVPSFQFLRLAARLVVSPRQLYSVAERMVAPAMFSNIAVTHTWHSPVRLTVSGKLATGYRPSEAVFRLCHGNVVALPRLLGLPASSVEEQVVAGDHGRLVLKLPASLTIASRIGQRVRSVFAFGEAMRGMARQQVDLEASVEALRASRHELRQVVERLPEGVLIHRAGTIAWANAAMLASLGLERLDEVIGRSVLELMPPEDRPAVAEQVARAAVNQVPEQRTEYRVLRKDGTTGRLEAGIAQIVEFEGAPARLIVCRDLTEQYRMRDQLALAERMALLGRLAAGVAHEINNPLAYTHASLEVAARDLATLDRGSVATRLGESLARAREGTERVREIVRDLKMLSRAEDEATDAVELAPLLDSTLAIAVSSLAAKARVIRRYGDVPRARATPGRLGQVFLNLLLNAADAIPEGVAGHHEVVVATSRDTRGRAVVEISDSGVGISAEHAPRVFDPFFTTKPAGAGTGLGLAICHRIVTQLGGEITFSSRPGRTVFRVALPAVEARPPPATPRALVPTRRGRVLVVDDEHALLRAIADLIGDDHDVVTAASGRDALAVLQLDRRFDVVLADLMMDDVSGRMLFENVRADHPGLDRRFVFMTGGVVQSRDQELLSSLPNRCIEKPFDADDLLRAINELIAHADTAS